MATINIKVDRRKSIKRLLEEQATLFGKCARENRIHYSPDLGGK